jgi:hypothetical protein
VGGGEECVPCLSIGGNLDRATTERSACSVLSSRERSSRALSLSGADGVPEYVLEWGEWEDTEGEVCEQC